MSHLVDQGQDHDEVDHNGAATKSLNPTRSVAEWTTLAISVTILLAVIGLATFLSLAGDGDPVNINVDPKLDQLRIEQDSYYVPVEVVNEGDVTAEDVVVRAELDTGAGEPETAEITIVFLAGGERASGTFVFETDPSAGELTVRGISYVDP